MYTLDNSDSYNRNGDISIPREALQSIALPLINANCN